jgi:Peptidase family M28
MYRGTWLLVGLPLLVVAFSVERPPALPAPALPPTFDGGAAISLAQELSGRYPDRAPGTAGSAGAVRWLAEKMRFFGFCAPKQRCALPTQRSDVFEATIPGVGRKRLQNISFAVDGRSPDAIVVMAHRDNNGLGPGANDNASGTAALIELARAYGSLSGSSGRAVVPAHTLLFLSTDGGSFGGLGAARFAEHHPGKIVGVVNLDSIAGRAAPRIELGGDQARSPAASLVETAAARIAEQTGSGPRRTTALGQLTDLGFPFTFYEQGPFVARGIPAITLTTAGDRPPASFGDTPERLNRKHLTDIGRATQGLVGSIDDAGLVGGTRSYVYLGQRIVRGWAIQFALVAMLLPFVVTAVDLFARCRRRKIPVAPAVRALRSRLGFWLWAGLVFWFLGVVGVWPNGAARPLNPESHAATHWPLLGLVLFAALAVPGWLVSRARLTPRRPATAEEELGGHTAAMLGLGLLSLLVVATNPFALIFLLPSLHVWLWLPHLRDRRPGARLALLAAGLAGPFILIGSFMFRYGLGLDAPWYLAELVAIDYVSIVAFVLALLWLAGVSQLTAIATGRYAPYPAAAERPPLGPIRSTVRAVVLGFRGRRTARGEQKAMEI